MSLTLTSAPKNAAIKESVIYLSPSKRLQRTIPPPPNLNTHRSKHSPKDIYSWVFRAEAIAPCFVRDLFNLQHNEFGSFDFSWLGAVPCRSMKIVGMVVGVQIYEKKIVYTVDDGTDVIDCTHRQQPPKPPLKQEIDISKYKSIATVEPPPSPKPIAKVGQFIQVIGNRLPLFESIHLSVDQITLCSSSNDELVHTRAVRELHRTSYSSPHDFVIPTLAQTPYPQTPVKNLSSPSNSNFMASSPPSSVSSSPVKEPCYISPTKTVPTKQTPIKLRHPSRLHTHDLTANTFRIYIKYYMDCAPDDDFEDDIYTTPTKFPRSDDTPRPSLRYRNCTNSPRRIPQPDFGYQPSSTRSFSPQPLSSRKKGTRTGFTLSYLRRVQELSLLASRVVDTVSKRRVREEMKKMKESGKPLVRSAPSWRLSPDQKRAKMKELFRWAIIKHLKEGCIIIWDGPVRQCPDTSIMSISSLWKANASTSTEGGNSTLFGTTLGAAPSLLTDDDDEGMLSDPNPNEEAYVSLTPDFVADFVEEAIKMLVERKVASRNPYAGATNEEILDTLRTDDRWQYVGAWAVNDALKKLEAEGRAWGGKGRWDLTA